MDQLADTALQALTSIQSGAIGLTAVSIALNVYLFMELRRIQREWMADVKNSLSKSEQREQLNAEIISVLSAVDRKIRKPSP